MPQPATTHDGDHEEPDKEQPRRQLIPVRREQQRHDGDADCDTGPEGHSPPAGQ